MESLKKLAELIPFLEPYPSWVKVLVGAWTLLSATLLLALLFAPRTQKAPHALVVTGRIRSQLGAPIPAAAVELDFGTSRIDDFSDSEGIFSIEAAPDPKVTQGRIRIAASGYSTYDRVVQIGPESADLGVFSLRPDSTNSGESAGDPAVLLQARQEALLEPPVDVVQAYSSVAASGNAGVVKLLSASAIRANRSVLELNGEGRYYSFLRRTHEYGYGSDIKFEAGKFSTGFAGLDYGHFLNLGPVPFSELAAAKAEPPTWLPPEKHDAWRYMWSYSPPSVTIDARRAQRDARSKVVGGISLAETAAAVPGNAYLLRSISFRDSDLLIAIRAERLSNDGSIILVWAILHTFDTPVASGPEPELF